MKSLQVNWKMMHKSKKLKIFIFCTRWPKREIDIDKMYIVSIQSMADYLNGKVTDY